MKTKNFLSLAAMALLMTACSNEDTFVPYDTIEPENTANEITIIATLSGDAEATTRGVSDNGTDIIAKWEVDEEIAVLFKVGSTDTKSVAKITNVDGSGTATIQFTVPFTTAEDTPCTLVYPASAANDAKTGVKTYAELFATQNGTLDGLDVRVGEGTIQVATPGLTVSTNPTAQFAIFKFTVKDIASTNLDASELKISDGAGNVITTITPASAANVLYAALPPVATAELKWFDATVSGKHYINKGSAILKARNYYPQTLKLATVGDLMAANGKFYADAAAISAASTTAIGVIAYLGNDATTEAISDGGGHGLVLCLKNAASAIAWSTNISSQAYTGNAFVTDVAGLTRSEGVSGYSATADLATDATNYPAAAAAKNYTDLTAPTGTTGWFLPSAQQWVKMQTGLGALEESSITWNSWFDPSHTAADKWENAIKKAGSGNYESMSAYLFYWSSSESTVSYAVSLSVDPTGTGAGYGFSWSGTAYKNNAASDRRVRPVLAF